jgi:hypothetical protein
LLWICAANRANARCFSAGVATLIASMPSPKSKLSLSSLRSSVASVSHQIVWVRSTSPLATKIVKGASWRSKTGMA